MTVMLRRVIKLSASFSGHGVQSKATNPELLSSNSIHTQELMSFLFFFALRIAVENHSTGSVKEMFLLELVIR